MRKWGRFGEAGMERHGEIQIEIWGPHGAFSPLKTCLSPLLGGLSPLVGGYPAGLIWESQLLLE